MMTMTVQAEVTADRLLKLEVPCDLPPGQVVVVLAIQPKRSLPLSEHVDWSHLFGLGREVWQGVDRNWEGEAPSEPLRARPGRAAARTPERIAGRAPSPQY
jgi:hypothetical protein